MAADLSHLLDDNDAVNVLVDLFLDGVRSGAVSTIATLLAHEYGQDDAVRLAHSLSNAFQSDPLNVQGVREAIHRRLTGQSDDVLRHLGCSHGHLPPRGASS